MIKNPDAIATKGELDDVIAQLEAFEREHGPAGIVRIQGSSGSRFEIVTAESVRGRIGAVGEETVTNYWSTRYLHMSRNQYE